MRRTQKRSTQQRRGHLIETLESRQVFSAAPYLDGFEESTLNPFWTKYEQSGTIVYPSSNVVRTGQQSLQLTSQVTSQDKWIHIEHVFDTPTYGTFSVWMFDTGADVWSSNSMMLALEGDDDAALIQVPDYDLGAGNDGSKYKYTTSSQDSGESGIDRTNAWHQFKIQARPDSVVYEIDGITVFTKQTGLAVNKVGLWMFAPNWRPGFTTYFDDFSFEPYTVNTQPTNGFAAAVVASDAVGNSMVAWESVGTDGNANGIYAQRLDHQGAAIGGNFRVNEFTVGEQWQPRVAMNGNGQSIIIWDGAGAGDSRGVYGQLYDANGAAVGGNFLVNTYIAGVQMDSSVAIDSAGNFVVSWSSLEQTVNYSWDIYFQRFDSQGNKLGSETAVVQQTGNQDPSRIAMAPNGQFVIAWNSADANGYGVHAQRYAADGTPVGNSFLVNTATAGDQQIGDIVMNPNGSFIVSFTDYHVTNGDVYVRRFSSAGTPLSNPVRANTTTSGRQWYSDVEVDSSGNFLVVWEATTQDKGTMGIYGQRFLANGSKYGSEVRLNEISDGDQRIPSVALDAVGDVVVVWSGESAGVGEGVYARYLPFPRVSIYDASLTEPDAGIENVNVSVVLSNQSLWPTQVSWRTSNGTAVAPADFESASRTLVFQPGEISKSVTIAVKGDTMDEYDESLNVSLTTVRGGVIADGKSLLTILDNDLPPTLVISDVTIFEGFSGTKMLTFTVSLSQVSGKAITVQYATRNGTATAGSDYVTKSGTLTFSPNLASRNIEISVHMDSLFEFDEEFFIDLLNATNATIHDAVGVGRILNDD